MTKSLFLLISTIVLISSCSKSNNEIIPASNQQGQTKTAGRTSNPFTGSVYYSVSTQTLGCDVGTFSDFGTFAGAGILSHLGNSTSLIRPAVTYLSNGVHVEIECAEFTAANGDKLYCYTHPYDIIATPAAGASIGTVQVDFTGGTGRFANATGGFTGTVTVPFTPGSASLTGINGTINY